MENNRLGCINCNKNGCKNIQKISEYYKKIMKDLKISEVK